MNMSQIKARLLKWILGDFLIELQSIDMLPELRSAVQEYLQILRDIRDELKLIRATQS